MPKDAHDSLKSPGKPAFALDDAVNDRGLAMTSSFSNMVLFGQCMAYVNDLSPYEAILSRLVEAENSSRAARGSLALTLREGLFYWIGRA